jgi:hypothetical protein
MCYRRYDPRQISQESGHACTAHAFSCAGWNGQCNAVCRVRHRWTGTYPSNGLLGQVLIADILTEEGPYIPESSLY